MDTSRVDGVKAPQHRGTPRPCTPMATVLCVQPYKPMTLNFFSKFKSPNMNQATPMDATNSTHCTTIMTTTSTAPTPTCVERPRRETVSVHSRRLSHGHVDGVTAVWHRVDAVDAKLKFGKGWKSR